MSDYTTKGEVMTNKELAGKLSTSRLLKGMTVADLENIEEAARRLRELPDPTPEPVKDLRWLVERHVRVLGGILWERVPDGYSAVPWTWRQPNDVQSYLSTEAAITVVRGIVKGLCDDPLWDWVKSPVWGWIVYVPGESFNTDTELEAIDALLTAMEGKS